MERREWIADAVEYMFSIGLYKPKMSRQAFEIAESLYNSYVVEQGEENEPCEPSHAVEDDLSYW